MNKKLRVFAVITGILLGFCVIVGAFLFTHAVASKVHSAIPYLQAVSFVLMPFFGLYYLFIGCKKSVGHILLKVFMGLLALCLFLLLFNTEVMFFSTLCIADTALRFAAVCVLLLGTDLGEGKSKSLAGSVLLLSLAEMVCLWFSPNVHWTNWMGDLIVAVCGIALFLFICFKYADKAARGRK